MCSRFLLFKTVRSAIAGSLIFGHCTSTIGVTVPLVQLLLVTSAIGLGCCLSGSICRALMPPVCRSIQHTSWGGWRAGSTSLLSPACFATAGAVSGDSASRPCGGGGGGRKLPQANETGNHDGETFNQSSPGSNLKADLFIQHTGKGHLALLKKRSSTISPSALLLFICTFCALCLPSKALCLHKTGILMVDDKGKNMKCLTFFLMLPETVKNRSKKSSKKVNSSSSSSGSSGNGGSSSSSKLPPVCYEIITLKTKKKKKMAADIFPRKKPANSNTTALQQYHQQNINNNNIIPAPNWQGLYPTIRER